MEFARIGNDTGTDGKHGNILFDHACGKQIELEPADGVPGIGAAVHFHNDGNDPALAGFGLKLANNFGNEASLAFVSGADSGVCTSKLLTADLNLFCAIIPLRFGNLDFFSE